MSKDYALTFCLLLAAAGCSGSSEDKWSKNRPTVVPAAGVVLHDGQPLAGATVLFRPEAEGSAASAVTDASGRFQLQTFAPGDGAVPGNYKVSVSKIEQATVSSEDLDRNVPPPVEKHLIPKKYSDFQTSGLTAQVPADGVTTLEIKVEGQP